MIQEKIKGVGVALITPFNNFEVDYEALARMVDHVIEGGVDYILVLGTTGETPTLTADERKALQEEHRPRKPRPWRNQCVPSVPRWR